MKTFDIIKKRINKVSKLMNLSDREVDVILSYKRIKHAKLNIGEKSYEAMRILHNDAIGPGKGGIRYHPGVCEDEVKSLAFWMSLKNSLAGLPYGGAKGGIKVNPKELNKKDKNEIYDLGGGTWYTYEAIDRYHTETAFGSGRYSSYCLAYRAFGA